jgi:hypothetical protein
MLQLLQDALSSPAGSFAFVFSIMVLGGWLIYFVTRKVTEINTENSTLAKSVLKMETNIDESRRDLSYLKGTIDLIGRQAPPLAQSHSPISLNVLGLEVAKELDVVKVIARCWDKIYAHLNSALINKNAYDIQQYILEQISVEPEQFLDQDGITQLKEYAFNKGMPLQYYTPVYGITIRDKFLLAKGIKIDEIDIHDPTKKRSE